MPNPEVTNGCGYNTDDAPLPSYNGVLKDVQIGELAPPTFFTAISEEQNTMVVSWAGPEGMTFEREGEGWRRTK